MKAVANNFITERNSSDAIAMGYGVHVHTHVLCTYIPYYCSIICICTFSMLLASGSEPT